MKNIVNLLWIFSTVQFLFSCNNPEPEDYLIPQGYKGRVNIIFNQKQGAGIRYENGRRVYDIPVEGVLFTQFKDVYGFIDHNYYYVDKNGKRTKLRIYHYEYNKDGTTKWAIENPNETGIFLDGTTGGYGQNGEYKSQEFLVSDYANLDSFYTAAYIINFEKKLGDIINGNFRDTLTLYEMDSIRNLLDKKKSSN